MEIVSSQLSGPEKVAYDNGTNNARRMKLIMLKNHYQGYGCFSSGVISCLIPDDIQDEELPDTPSFDQRRKEL